MLKIIVISPGIGTRRGEEGEDLSGTFQLLEYQMDRVGGQI